MNALFDALEAAGIDFGGGFTVSGRAVGIARKAERWIKLTSVAGSGASATYAWTEQVRPAGAWVDGPRTGTTTLNPAIRENGTNTLSLPMIARAWQEVDGMHFIASDC